MNENEGFRTTDLTRVLAPEILGFLNPLDTWIKIAKNQGFGILPVLREEFFRSNLPLTRHCAGIYSVPFLNPDFCQYLLRRAETLTYLTNPSEQTPYQIPEVVLNHYPETQPLHNALELAAYAFLWPIFGLLTFRQPNCFTTIQLARYGASDIAAGNWHHDEASEFTAVVSLDPSLYTGGGTQFYPEGVFADPFTLPPLPAGHCLLFTGRTILHQGLPVTQGSRDLLVFWMVNNENLAKWY